MSYIKTQQEKAEILRELHHNKNLLVLPNIWDPIGALLIEEIGFPAVATASASMALSNGYVDGEKIPFKLFVQRLKLIAESVNVPVTADIESGFAADNVQLAENMKRLIGTGIVGINFEDSDKQSGQILSIESQCEKIRLIRKVALEMNVSLFINTRTDVYIKGNLGLSEDGKLQETLKRAEAYVAAGADCLFPIGLKNIETIKSITSSFAHPVNIIASSPGIPDLKTLKAAGVARVSMGPSLLRIAIRAMKEAVSNFKSLEGLEAMTENTVTMDVLENLVLGGKKA